MGEGREKERERNIHQLSPMHTPASDQIPNPGTCPDPESNRRLSALLDDTRLSGLHCLLRGSCDNSMTYIKSLAQCFILSKGLAHLPFRPTFRGNGAVITLREIKPAFLARVAELDFRWSRKPFT